MPRVNYCSVCDYQGKKNVNFVCGDCQKILTGIREGDPEIVRSGKYLEISFVLTRWVHKECAQIPKKQGVKHVEKTGCYPMIKGFYDYDFFSWGELIDLEHQELKYYLGLNLLNPCCERGDSRGRVISVKIVE